MIPSSPSRSCRRLAGGLAATIAAAMAIGCGGPASHPAIGTRLERLAVAPIAFPDGGPPPLAGRVTLLNFWGTWCPPCRRELPGLARIATGLADDQRFQLVAVALPAGGGGDPVALASEAGSFLAAAGLKIPAFVCVDPAEADALTTRLGLSSLPSSYLLGGDGTVRRVWVGYRPRDEAEIAAAIVAALKELPSRPE